VDDDFSIRAIGLVLRKYNTIELMDMKHKNVRGA